MRTRLEISTANAQQDAVQDCADGFESGSAQEACIDAAKQNYNTTTDMPQVVEIAGIVGLVCCGYLGYKAIKEENETTGIVDDWA